MYKTDDLINMDTGQLHKMLEEDRKQHYLLKLGVRTKHLKNSHEAKEKQEDIARILTELNRRKLVAKNSSSDKSLIN